MLRIRLVWMFFLQGSMLLAALSPFQVWKMRIFPLRKNNGQSSVRFCNREMSKNKPGEPILPPNIGILSLFQSC